MVNKIKFFYVNVKHNNKILLKLSRKFCKCLNKFGSYDKANDPSECFIKCSGDDLDTCGGLSYQPVSVYKFEDGFYKTNLKNFDF